MPDDIKQYTTSIQSVYDTLRNRIMTMELPPGTTLDRRSLGAEFGVSQTPIRDAMTRLSDEHLVDVYRQSKTMVSRINLQELCTAYFLRNAVRHDLATLLARGVSPADFECAKHITRMQEIALDSDETLEVFVAQQGLFAQSLYNMAGITDVYDALAKQSDPFLRYRILDVGLDLRRDKILQKNYDILNAIEQQDCDQITLCLKQQLEALLDSQTELKEKFPHYFS